MITDEANKALTAMFKEANLPQATAQKFIDYVAPQILQAIEAPFKQYQETREGWQKEITDKYGSKLPEVKATIGRALDGLQNPKLFPLSRMPSITPAPGTIPQSGMSCTSSPRRSLRAPSSKPEVQIRSATGIGQHLAAAVYPHLPNAG